MLIKRQMVEAEGFRDGSQNMSAEAALVKLSAQSAQEQERVRGEMVDRVKWLEALHDTLLQRHDLAEKLWHTLEVATNGLPPQIGLPLVGVVLSALAAGGETVLLAPVMDGFGIVDRFWQYFTALTLVLISSGLLELSTHQIRHPLADTSKSQGKESKHNEHQPLRYAVLKVSINVLLTFFAFTLLLILGWWRAEEMIFSATLKHTELGNFLSQNPSLTRVCVTLLTIGLPVFAATAFEWGFDKLRLAWEWRKARHAFIRYSRKLAAARRKREAVLEKRNFQIAALNENEKDLVNAYLQCYELGRLVGAQQQPLWQVIVKII